MLQRFPGEVAVLHGEFPGEGIRNILIPFGANIHTRLAAEIAPALAEYFNAKLRIVVVFEPDVPQYRRDEKIKQINEIIQENSLSASLETIIERDVLAGIVRISKDADLVLMGGRTGDFLELLLAKSLTQEITERVKCPVLWVKEYEERKSFWASLLKPYEKGA